MSALNRHFARHYVEMVVVMFAGMLVLGMPAEPVLAAFGSGWSELRDDAPAAMLGLMGFTMTAPMIAWMRYRGHGWQPSLEMGASMALPTLAVIALLAAGLVSDVGTLLLLEHVAMFAGMFAVMLARPEEYSHHHAGHAQAHRATA